MGDRNLSNWIYGYAVFANVPQACSGHMLYHRPGAGRRKVSALLGLGSEWRDGLWVILFRTVLEVGIDGRGRLGFFYQARLYLRRFAQLILWNKIETTLTIPFPIRGDLAVVWFDRSNRALLLRSYKAGFSMANPLPNKSRFPTRSHLRSPIPRPACTPQFNG